MNTDGCSRGQPGPSSCGGIFRNCRGFVHGCFALSLGSGFAYQAEWVGDGYRYSTLQGLEIPLDRVRFNICCFLIILISQWHLGKLLTLAVTNSWPIRQLDVNNAFLQGSLTDEVFMEQGLKTFLLKIMFASCISLFMAFGKPLVLGITSFVPFSEGHLTFLIVYTSLPIFGYLYTSFC